MIPAYRLWILISAVALMLLLLWSQLSDIGIFSVRKKYENLIPKRTPSKGPNAPPILAYWILGSRGENKRILRLLKAIYHPRNRYLLQLDSSLHDQERVELAILVRSEKTFRVFGNVDIVGKSYSVNQMGASGLAAVLHAAALLLRISRDWDWFIPLSTSDYPISTQDDILYAFTYLPRDLNFVGYTNDTYRRQNASQIAVDPSLYLTEKAPIFYASETRQQPDAFQLFQGSSWMILSRGLVEHIVNGLDNLPRKLLMYFNNVPLPLQSYFQTILCNTPHFQNATINNDLRYIINHDHHNIVENQAIFARPFRENDGELQVIDEKILNRGPERVVPGKWCTKTGLMNSSTSHEDLCSLWGDIDDVEARARGIALRSFLSRLVVEKKSITSMCRRRIMQK